MNYSNAKRIENATAELERRQIEKNTSQDNTGSENTSSKTKAQATEGLLYFGNPHESIPLRLLKDPYLTPKAKFAWQVIKLNAKVYQGTAFPSYEELQQLLSERPYSNEKASPKVVSQVLLLLRLCRWLTFCETARNAQGHVLGNIYIIHDEPVGIMDALHFNEDYLGFVEQHCHHRDKIVSQAANQIMQELLSDDTLSHYGAHIHLMRSRYMNRHHQLDMQTKQTLHPKKEQQLDSVQENLLTSHTEGSYFEREGGQKTTDLLTSHREDSQINLTSITEDSDKSLVLGCLPLGKSASQYNTSTNINNMYSTVLKEVSERFPVYRFSELERHTVLKISRELNLPQTTFQEVLIETALRIQQNAHTDKAIKNIVGYLCKTLQNAAQGQFKPYLLHQAKIQLRESRANVTNYKSVVPKTAILDTPKALTQEELSRRSVFMHDLRKILKQVNVVKK